MADRQTAALCASIFKHLAYEGKKEIFITRRDYQFAKELWNKLKEEDYDFSMYQMACDNALVRLGLARPKKDSEFDFEYEGSEFEGQILPDWVKAADEDDMEEEKDYGPDAGPGEHVEASGEPSGGFFVRQKPLLSADPRDRLHQQKPRRIRRIIVKESGLEECPEDDTPDEIPDAIRAKIKEAEHRARLKSSVNFPADGFPTRLMSISDLAQIHYGDMDVYNRKTVQWRQNGYQDGTAWILRIPKEDIKDLKVIFWHGLITVTWKLGSELFERRVALGSAYDQNTVKALWVKSPVHWTKVSTELFIMAQYHKDRDPREIEVKELP